jgi:hypothetical protein
MIIFVAIPKNPDELASLIVGIDFPTLRRLQAGDRVSGVVNVEGKTQTIMVFAARDDAMAVDFVRATNPKLPFRFENDEDHGSK